MCYKSRSKRTKAATILLERTSKVKVLGVQHGYLRDGPALVGAGHLELHHRDGIGGTTHNTEATTNTLLFIDNHIGPTAPGFCSLVHGIAFDDSREAFHTDAV